jgi:hypothetical protein
LKKKKLPIKVRETVLLTVKKNKASCKFNGQFLALLSFLPLKHQNQGCPIPHFGSKMAAGLA